MTSFCSFGSAALFRHTSVSITSPSLSAAPVKVNTCVDLGRSVFTGGSMRNTMSSSAL